MGLTAEDLQKLNCAECHDDHKSCVIVLSPRCHQGGGVFAKYHKDSNSIEIVCATCDRFVASVDVAKKAQGRPGENQRHPS